MNSKKVKPHARFTSPILGEWERPFQEALVANDASRAGMLLEDARRARQVSEVRYALARSVLAAHAEDGPQVVEWAQTARAAATTPHQVSASLENLSVGYLMMGAPREAFRATVSGIKAHPASQALYVNQLVALVRLGLWEAVDTLLEGLPRLFDLSNESPLKAHLLHDQDLEPIRTRSAFRNLELSK